jgi:hypothetical protein
MVTSIHCFTIHTVQIERRVIQVTSFHGLKKIPLGGTGGIGVTGGIGGTGGTGYIGGILW